MIDRVSQVLQRINQIENNFSAQKPSFKNIQVFEDKLNEAEKTQKQIINPLNTKNTAKRPLGANTAPTAKTTPPAASAASPAPTAIADIIKQSAAKYGVDEQLIKAIAKNESNYQPDAVSEAGAVGVMQLMPSTAEGLGVKNIYNPYDNIDGGTKYLKELLDTFDGDITKTVAAYNAGPQAVKAYGGVPPYSETQNYVNNVLADYK